jgi:hypothetical protein
MMTAEERVEKKTKKKDNKIEGDTKIKDVPGLLVDKLVDKLDDSITKQFIKIKDNFKKEKQGPVDKPQEPSLAKKEKKPKDENDTLRAILNSMISNSKYQEQMIENSKSLQSIADKTLSNVTNLNDNLNNIEQPEVNNTVKEKTSEDKTLSNVTNLNDNLNNIEQLKVNNIVKEKKSEEQNNKKEDKIPNNQKLAISIGESIGTALKPQFDKLGKTFKDELEVGIAQMVTAIDGISGNSMLDSALAAVAELLGGSKARKARMGKGAVTLSGGLLLGSAVSNGIDANERDSQYIEIQKRMNEKKNLKKDVSNLEESSGRMAQGKLEPVDNKNKINENLSKENNTVQPVRQTKKEIIKEVPIDTVMPTSDGKGEYKKTDKGWEKDGKIVAPDIQKQLESLVLKTFNKGANQNYKEPTPADAAFEEKFKAAKDAKAAADAQEKARKKEQSSLNNSLRPNYGFKSISELTQEQTKKQEAIQQLAPVENKTDIKSKKSDKLGLMSDVTDQKMALASDNKPSQPIVINNNSSTGASPEPASIGFGSASPRNTSTAINDYFRNNGRLHDSVYG